MVHQPTTLNYLCCETLHIHKNNIIIASVLYNDLEMRGFEVGILNISPIHVIRDIQRINPFIKSK